ncbi:MAG: site-specific integrase [Clostridia bacterium]|nr:site-specific integrase [Clostridia bacterium]
MAIYKDYKRGTYYSSYYFTDYSGKKRRKTKRGFKTKKEAQEWERHAIMMSKSDIGMTFGDFIQLYYRDRQPRLRENTWLHKVNVIETKILPYFKDRMMNDIMPRDIIAWQNDILKLRKPDGTPFKDGYLKSIHKHLSCIFNHAVRYYRLPQNPAAIAGYMSREAPTEMQFWTKEEYQRFADAAMDEPQHYYAFEVLYWCGIRYGELRALTVEDFDFENNTLRINKSHQRIGNRDVITPPKTAKSNRIIRMPRFLAEEMKDYIKSFYHINPTDRIFDFDRHVLHRAMRKYAPIAGVKVIRIHDLRHSHVSLLIDLGFTALAIADRMGHESIDITFRYAHLFPNKQVEMADRLDREWGGREVK